MRRLGIEEELLLADAATGRPLTVAERVIGRAPSFLLAAGHGASGGSPDQPGGHVGKELQQQQVEIDTLPRTELSELERDLRAWRAAAGEAAQEVGARVLATGTSPLPTIPAPTVDARYAAIVDRFGLTARQQLTCGCHVHVAVTSDEEGVGVLDRIRPWLPALLAISANSPYWQAEDTGYASYRSQAWARWPTAGPTEHFGSAKNYHSTVRDLLGTGVLLDRRMVYFDARLSPSYPTVEIRVADVCLYVEDAIVVAALCRGLVDTAATAWAAGEASPDVPTDLLRLAGWRAGHDGVDGSLLDPFTGRPRPAFHVVSDLVAHVRPALVEAGDLDLVEARLSAVVRRGTGARRQRLAGAGGDLVAVVRDLACATLQ